MSEYSLSTLEVSFIAKPAQHTILCCTPSRPRRTCFATSFLPLPRSTTCLFNYTFENLAKSIDRFTQTIGLQTCAIYVFKYWKEPTAEPGLTWFHCHRQLHMDFSFMALFDYV